MDTITIKHLEVRWHVGVPEQERLNPQRLLVTIAMNAGFSAAASADDLTATIDYHAVVQRILRFGEGRSWQLIEKVADDIARLILAEFKPESVRVEVKKFIIPETEFIAVSVERKRGVEAR